MKLPLVLAGARGCRVVFSGCAGQKQWESQKSSRCPCCQCSHTYTVQQTSSRNWWLHSASFESGTWTWVSSLASYPSAYCIMQERASSFFCLKRTRRSARGFPRLWPADGVFFLQPSGSASYHLGLAAESFVEKNTSFLVCACLGPLEGSLWASFLGNLYAAS